ncbi:MAG TPA: glycosyltransferase family 39 protein [Tepidisphaeraceae bacterium]|nr:glycosyltransferase family 39 protein [Tepidisphaeraceae bacterium]
MPEIRPIRAGHLVVLALILCAGIFLRWYKIGSTSLWTDEFLSMEVSSGHGYEDLMLSRNVILPAPQKLVDLNSTGSWSQLFLSLKGSNHPPLYFCVLRIWRTLWQSDSDVTTRSLSAVLSLLAILLAFDAVRWANGNTAALWAAALLAVASPQIEFSQETRGYMMLITFMMGCCAALARIERLGFSRQRLAALILCAAGMLLTHYLSFAVIAALMIYVAIRFDRIISRKILLSLLGVTFAFLIAWGPIMWAQSHNFFGRMTWMKELPENHVPMMFERFATLPLRFFSSPQMRPSAASYLGLVLFILPIPFLRKHPQLLLWCLIMWIDVLVIAVGDVTRSTRGLLLIRYTLPAAAAANVLVAILFIHLRGWMRHIVPATLALCAAMTLPLSYNRHKPDWHQLADYIDHNCRSDSLFVLYPDERSSAYTGLLDMGLSHYSQSWGQRPTVLLDRPADQKLIRQFRPNKVIDVISGSIEAQDIIPGCKVLETIYFPEIGICSRVEMPPDEHTASVWGITSLR